MPGLKEKGLSPYQGLLHAIWTDERFASCCVSMRNTDQVRENAEAARVYKPLTTAELNQMRDALVAAGPTLCAGCDGPLAAWPRRHNEPSWATSRGFPHLSRSLRLSRRSRDGFTSSFPTPLTQLGRRPTSKRPVKPAPANSISPGSCRAHDRVLG